MMRLWGSKVMPCGRWNWPGSFGAPLELEAACGGEFQHACVLVAVAHIKGAVRQHGHIRGQIEMRSVVAGHACLSQREQHLA